MNTLVLAIAAAVGLAGLILAAIRLLRSRLWPVRLLQFPLYVAGILAGLWIARVIHPEMPAWFDRAETWVRLFFFVTAGMRLLGSWLFDLYLKSYRRVVLPELLPKVTQAVAYLIGGLALVRIVYPERDITPLLATSAVTSLVLGLALQPILGNFFSGLVISLEQPFRVNDWIQLGDIEGRVVAITWRTTRLRTRDNDDVVVPNARIADQEVVNYHYPHPLHLVRIYVGIHYRTPPYRVDEVLRRAAVRVDGVLEKPSPEVWLVDFSDSAITYEVRVWIENVAGRPRLESNVRKQIWEELHRENITIPFPIRTIEIEPAARRIDVAQVEAATEPETEEGPRAFLFVSAGAQRGARFPLGSAPMVIGRSADCDLVLAEPRASAEHMRVSWGEEGPVLEDLDSRAGTRVNDRTVTRCVLRDLDRIHVGDTILVFETA